MKKSPVAFLFSTLALLALAPAASARQGANPNVNYSPQVKIVQNLLVAPAQFSYTLGITVPTTIPTGLATSVTLSPGALADPTTGLSSSTAVYDITQAPSLAYITLSSGAVTGAPGQPIVIPFTGGTTGINVTVTLTFPISSAAGSYAYFMSGSWPTTDGVAPGEHHDRGHGGDDQRHRGAAPSRAADPHGDRTQPGGAVRFHREPARQRELAVSPRAPPSGWRPRADDRPDHLHLCRRHAGPQHRQRFRDGDQFGEPVHRHLRITSTNLDCRPRA